jgi:hypothetical protein
MAERLVTDVAHGAACPAGGPIGRRGWSSVVCTAQTIWDIPTAMLARFFTLLADATEQGDPADFWDHFPPRQLAHIFGSIAASQAEPPQTAEQAMAALVAMLEAHRAVEPR